MAPYFECETHKFTSSGFEAGNLDQESIASMQMGKHVFKAGIATGLAIANRIIEPPSTSADSAEKPEKPTTHCVVLTRPGVPLPVGK